MSDIGPAEQAVRADLALLGEDIASSLLGVTAVILARRLDEAPADREATMLSRELRQLMAVLRADAGGDKADAVSDFLARIAAPDKRHTAN